MKKFIVGLISLVLVFGTVFMVDNQIIANNDITTYSNSQASTVRKKRDYFELIFYNFQSSNLNIDDISKKNPQYRELTREDLFYYTSYLAFDSQGYIIPSDQILIDQTQWDLINQSIVAGIDLFKDNNKTTAGSIISFPITFTTPEGIQTVFTVNLNLGGKAVSNSVAGLQATGNDITYNIENGPLTWDQLKVLIDARGYDYLPSDPGIYAIPLEVVQKTLEDLNANINAGVTGNNNIQFIGALGTTAFGNSIGSVNVALVKSSFTVTYNDGVDGEEVFTDQIFSNLQNGTTTPSFVGIPTREGFLFTGWSPSISDTVNVSITYVAQWTAVAEINLYNVTYTDGMNHLEIFEDESYTVPHGEATPVFSQETPFHEEYEFIGWNAEIDEVVTKDAVYEAQWKTISKTAESSTPNTGISKETNLYLFLLFSSMLSLSTICIMKFKKYSK